MARILGETISIVKGKILPTKNSRPTFHVERERSPQLVLEDVEGPQNGKHLTIATSACGANCSLPSLLRDFGGTDSSGRARGTGGARSSGIGKWSEAGAGHKGWFARCARTGEESTTTPGWANATITQQIRARLSAGAGRIGAAAARGAAAGGDLATDRLGDLDQVGESASRHVARLRGPEDANQRMSGGARQSRALSPAISEASIFVKPKHFLPRSLSDAPIR